MTPEEQTAAEARAARCLRRGELSEAIRLYEELASACPSDASLAAKLAALRDSVQPAELQAAKARLDGPSARPLEPLTPEEEAERLLALGDYPGAIAAYRRALAQRPSSELIRERLAELFRIAQASPPHSPTDSELPRERGALLRALLDRISARRRVRL